MADPYNNSDGQGSEVSGGTPDDNLHTLALQQFDAICSAQQEERAQCLQDRRFVSIAGAQWEGDWAEQFANSIMVEVNKTAQGVEKIIADYRANRIIVDFRAVDKGADDKTAETLNGMFRADWYDSKGQQAADAAFEEAVQGGMGAWRLTTRYSDDYDPDDDSQRICVEIIPDADQSVFWDMDGRLYDKSDANFCFVVTAMSPEAYKAAYNDDPASWPEEILKTYYDWYTPDIVRVAEYYRIEETSQVRLSLVHSVTGETDRRWQTDVTPEALSDLKVQGWGVTGQKRVKRRLVAKYTMSASGMIAPRQLIAGELIPVVPVYGKRWFIDNMERVRGHVRLAKDPQRIYNAQISKLTEICSIQPTERPIFTPEQIAGHETSWAEANLNRAPYSLLNAIIGPDGLPMSAAPIATVTPPQLPPVLAALVQITANDIAELTTNQDNADETKSNVSAEAMDLAATRTDAKSFTYMDNMRQSMQRCGEVYLSMAGAVYVEEGREVETLGEDGSHGMAKLQEPYTDKAGNYLIANDFAAGRYKVISDVTEATSTRRDKTVRTLIASAEVVAPFDPATASAMILTAVSNMDGEGMGDLQDFLHKKAVIAGFAKPTDAEKAELEKAQANQKPDPEAELAAAKTQALAAQAERDHALAGKAQAETANVTAQVGETKAKTVNTLANAHHTNTLAGNERRLGPMERIASAFKSLGGGRAQ